MSKKFDDDIRRIARIRELVICGSPAEIAKDPEKVKVLRTEVEWLTKRAGENAVLFGISGMAERRLEAVIQAQPQPALSR
jgi:hypothetical protein